MKKSGIADAGQLLFEVQAISAASDLLNLALASGEELQPDHLDQQLAYNKDMRRLYDEMLAGRRAFAERFGTASEPLVSFDRKFEPNEGWGIYLKQFG